ncbi:MAG: hypothetical protein IBX71_08800 [Candidatus Desulforudis sp.]|nr:hypothetical protein [Desulforudis sp.]
MIEVKRRALIFLALALVLGGSAVYLFLQMATTLEREMGEYVTVLVAGGDIPPRVRITEEMLTTTSIPRRFVQPTFVTDKEQAVKSAAIIPLPKGEILTSTVLREISQLPKDTRRVTLAGGGNTFFDQAVAVGDRVDIIAAFVENGQTVTRLVFGGLEVLAVDQGGRDQPVIQVAVSMDDALRLIRLQNTAQSLRVLRREVTQ